MRLAALLAALLPACASATAGSESVIGEVEGEGWTRYACEWDDQAGEYIAPIGASAYPPPVVQAWFVSDPVVSAQAVAAYMVVDGDLHIQSRENPYSDTAACIVYVWR